MLLWIVKNGEKTGPFEDYKLREMIREGEVDGDTGVWHEGAEGWVAAREVEVLKGEFVEKVVEPPPVPITIEMPPFLAWRRFGARTFDHFLYLLVFMSALRLGGFQILRDPTEQGSGWLILAQLLPAILMEGALLSSLGFTPGKWLMSLRVENILGKKLSTSHALVRSMRVWVLGMGMMNPLLLVLGHSVTLWFALKKGAPLWDLHSGFRVMAAELKSGRIILYWFFLAAVIAALMVVVWPELGPLVEAEMRRQGK